MGFVVKIPSKQSVILKNGLEEKKNVKCNDKKDTSNPDGVSGVSK
jgi:hypothetical protein